MSYEKDFYYSDVNEQNEAIAHLLECTQWWPSTREHKVLKGLLAERARLRAELAAANAQLVSKADELAAMQKQRDKLQAHFDADEEDRRQYIEAWANWIESKSELPIAEWLHAYAAAIPHPPRDGDEAKKRIWTHLDQRMRDAAETIDALQKEGEL